MNATASVVVEIDIVAGRQMLAKIVSDPAVWKAVADLIGTDDVEYYDLGDSSEALDVAQLVCQALAKAVTP